MVRYLSQGATLATTRFGQIRRTALPALRFDGKPRPGESRPQNSRKKAIAPPVFFHQRSGLAGSSVDPILFGQGDGLVAMHGKRHRVIRALHAFPDDIVQQKRWVPIDIIEVHFLGSLRSIGCAIFFALRSTNGGR